MYKEPSHACLTSYQMWVLVRSLQMKLVCTYMILYFITDLLTIASAWKSSGSLPENTACQHMGQIRDGKDDLLLCRQQAGCWTAWMPEAQDL